MLFWVLLDCIMVSLVPIDGSKVTWILFFLDGIIVFLILSRCHYGIQDFFNPLGDILMMAAVGISR